MSSRDEFGAFLIGFAVGGLTGAIVALLFAPQSGNETRTLIKEKAIELKDKAGESVEDAYAKAEAAALQARARFDELAKATKEQTTELTQKGQVIVEESREKISEAIAPKKKAKPAEPETPAS
jgi:gas vesicle protein